MRPGRTVYRDGRSLGGGVEKVRGGVVGHSRAGL
jgi:hypothetical protein